MAKRRKIEKEPPTTSATVVMMVALMILLLAFFIVLVSMSRIEVKKTKAALTSIASAFSALPGGSSPFFSIGGFSSKSTSPMTPLDEDFREIKKLVNQTKGQDKIQLLSDRGKRIVVLDQEVLFEPDQIKLKPEIIPFLKGLAAIIQTSPYWIEVGGHTDDIPPGPGAPAADNWTLSALRALAVVEFLNANGVADQRLSAYGYGPIRPLVPNTTPANRAMNQRVEIILDERLAAQSEELRALTAPGRLRYRGFTFDLFKPE